MKLQEIPIEQAKERRLKILEENRRKRKNIARRKNKHSGKPQDHEQGKMFIELKTAIDEYVKVTNQEINNINKIIELELDSIKV